MVDDRRLRQRFVERMDLVRGIEGLLDLVPDVYFWVKDAHGRFVLCNQALVALVGEKSQANVIGRRDSDFFPAELAATYMSDDRTVLATGEALVDRIELVRNTDGSVDWFDTTKTPVFDRRGRVIGVAGVTRDLKKMHSTNQRFFAMAPVIETIMSDYALPLTVASLAAKVDLSLSQFERQFKRKFRTTPRKYITRIRVQAACQLLATTDLPISEVAQQTGFYDQSHFSHQFRRERGMTPSRYRAATATAPGARGHLAEASISFAALATPARPAM